MLKNIVVGILLMLSTTSTFASIKETQFHKETEVNEFNDGDSVVKNAKLVAITIDVKEVTEKTMSIREYGKDIDMMCKKVQ